MYLDEGWPFFCIRRNMDSITVVRPVALAMNVGVTLVCLISITFVVERLERSRLQFGLTTLVAVVTSIAILLAFWQWNAGQQENVVLPGPPFVSDNDYVPLSFSEH